MIYPRAVEMTPWRELLRRIEARHQRARNWAFLRGILFGFSVGVLGMWFQR